MSLWGQTMILYCNCNRLAKLLTFFLLLLLFLMSTSGMTDSFLHPSSESTSFFSCYISVSVSLTYVAYSFFSFHHSIRTYNIFHFRERMIILTLSLISLPLILSHSCQLSLVRAISGVHATLGGHWFNLTADNMFAVQECWKLLFCPPLLVTLHSHLAPASLLRKMTRK